MLTLDTFKPHPWHNVPLVPPGRHAHGSDCHWVERIDYDGRACGLEVYQWQPGVKAWCLPNQHATGIALELRDYRWVSVCPLPMFDSEVEDLKQRLRKFVLSSQDVEILRQTVMDLIHSRKTYSD